MPANTRLIADVMWQFLKLGFTSFGGPIAHLGYFRQTLIEKHQWMKDSEYAQLVAICQFLPGPASSQVGFALGYHRAGFIGAVVAFVSFTAPSAVCLILFASALPGFSADIQELLIKALKLAAAVIVFQAVTGMWRSICVDIRTKIIACLSFVCLLFWQTAFSHLLVLIVAGLIGIKFLDTVKQQDMQIGINISRWLGRACIIVFIILLILAIFFVTQSKYQSPGIVSIFSGFYQTGALVFGGGHVVLPMLQQTVVASGWLGEETFIVGYGAAQAVPGPLFTLASFLGYEIPSAYSPWLTALIATFAIFLPGFLLIIGILPHWQGLSQNLTFAKAILGINAGVVGLLAATWIDPVVLTSAQSKFDFAILLAVFGLTLVLKVRIWHIMTGCLIYASLVQFL